MDIVAPGFMCPCQLNCSNKITYEKQVEIRRACKAQKTYVTQASFIANHVKEIKVNGTRRKRIRKKISVEFQEVDSEENKAEVVKNEAINKERKCTQNKKGFEVDNRSIEDSSDYSDEDIDLDDFDLEKDANKEDKKNRKKEEKLVEKKNVEKVITLGLHRPPKKNFNRIYTLEGEKVCKPFFLHVMGISSSRCNTALEKVRTKDIQDRRGVNGGWNKLKGEKLDKVLEHIASLPRYKPVNGPHLKDTISMPKGKYIQSFYTEYKELNPDNYVSCASYKKFFYEQVKKKTCGASNVVKNISMQLVHCKTCQTLQANLNAGADEKQINRAQKEHGDTWKEAEDSFKVDIEKANTDITFDCLVYHIDKVLLPYIHKISNEEKVEYSKKQKLEVYFLLVYSAKQRQTWVYLWLENEAGYGHQEIGSVLMQHILNETITETRELAIWSNSKSANKNLQMCLLLNSMCEEDCMVEKIKLGYIYNEHTALPTDADLAFVKRSCRRRNIFSDEECVQLLRTNRNKAKRKSYIVQRLSPWQFYTSEAIYQFFPNHNTTTTGVQIDWSTLKEIQLNFNEPYQIRVKSNNLKEDYLLVDLLNGNPDVLVPRFSWRRELSKLWPRDRRISKQKWDHLRLLLPLIPPQYHHIYTRPKYSIGCEDCDPEQDHNDNRLAVEISNQVLIAPPEQIIIEPQSNLNLQPVTNVTIDNSEEMFTFHQDLRPPPHQALVNHPNFQRPQMVPNNHLQHSKQMPEVPVHTEDNYMSRSIAQHHQQQHSLINQEANVQKIFYISSSHI